ncbi:MAG: hypothetical protein H7Z75_04895 [Ferruginibacter sp.]|nr:hypothetical protein [Cytophagales bacterium]
MKNGWLILILAGCGVCRAQTPTGPVPAGPPPAPEKSELRYALNESGSHYLRFTLLNQTWLRANNSNPGTTVNGVAADRTLDIGLRRTRFQLYGQLNDRTFVYFQFGQNNFNFLSSNAGNRKLAAFFHDAVGEYIVFKGQETLKLGGGLTIVNGLSRFSQPGVSTILTMDVPVFAQATVDQTDEFSRKLSVYARGQVGKIDYRFALSDPFPVQTNGTPLPPLSSYATFSQRDHHPQYQGLLMYQFFDRESHVTPGYATGTYLGKKKIFNLEAGIIAQRRAMWRTEGADTLYHRMLLWSVGAFYDAPVKAARGTALSAYLGYYRYDFGPGYLRYNGIMNPASGTSAPVAGFANAGGNGFPMFGTGAVLYGQVGYLLPKNRRRDVGQWQPYASLMHADYPRLADPVTVYNVGVNWLIQGHNSKLSLDYQNRPVYQATPAGELRQSGRRGALVWQYQVFF